MRDLGVLKEGDFEPTQSLELCTTIPERIAQLREHLPLKSLTVLLPPGSSPPLRSVASRLTRTTGLADARGFSWQLMVYDGGRNDTDVVRKDRLWTFLAYLTTEGAEDG
eukprot:gene50873-14882_t